MPVVLIVAVFVALLWHWHLIGWLTGVTFAVPALVALAARAPSPGGLQSSVCRYLGRLSYPLYCVHYPIIALTQFVAGSDDRRAFALAVLACVGVADLAGRLTGEFAEGRRRASSSASVPAP